MKKSILALLLAVLMVASLLPAAALADGPTENDVAAYTNKSGTMYYTTVGAAITAANKGGGGTVTLLKNAELKASDVSDSYVFNDGIGTGIYVDEALVLDLGGHTLTCKEYYGLDVTPYASLTVKRGTYVHEGGKYANTYTGCAIQANKVKEAGPGSTITIESDATIITDGDAVLCQGYNTVYVYGKIYCVSNGVFGMGPCNTVTLDGAYIKSDTYAVYQNPYTKNLPFYRAGSTYVIEDSTIIAGSNVQGVYLSNNTGIETTNHKLTIKNSDISAGIGVYLSCTDATIDGESTKIEYTNTTGNSIYFGHDGSGTVGSLAINAGEIVGPIGVRDPGSAGNAATISISGGEFDRPVNPDYLAEGYIYQLLSDGMYSYYKTMEEALAAAEPGDIITDLSAPGTPAMDVLTVTIAPNNGQPTETKLIQKGGSFKLPAAPEKPDCAFIGWSDGETVHDALEEVVISEDTTFTAVWKDMFDVRFVYGNGAADEVKQYVDGETCILPDVSNSGYIFLGWRGNDGHNYRAGDKITVTSDMTFTAVWGNLPDVDPEEPTEPEVPDFPFYDVNVRDWYYDAVKYVYNKGLMDGVDTHEFAPNATLTRAMVWTIIARAEGVNTTGGANWYAKAQEWVVAKGISDGENPSAAITRQELVTMLYRLAGEPSVSGTITAPDAASVSSWAGDAMVWAMNIGLIEGDENGAVTPTATATRAQAAAIFMRYIEA